MSFFQEVEAEAAVLVDRGLYKQVPLYTRNHQLFAKLGSGFIRLMADGSTSRGVIRLDYLSWDGVLCRDKLGRLCTHEHPDALPLEDNTKIKLLGGPK